MLRFVDDSAEVAVACPEESRAEAARAMTILLLFYFGSLALGESIILLLRPGRDENGHKKQPVSDARPN